MSLRDLKEEIYLVLQIKAGHGFGFATSPLIITANLAGNVHESFVTEPCPQPKFENEFVWVMDKTKMKSIWSDKVPIRVECFTVNHAHRSRIGYTIMNVKDAQIVQDESKISEKQIRLLGLSKDVSLLKPELSLSFYITDVPIQSPPLIPQFFPPLDDGKAQMVDGSLKVTLGSGKEHFKLRIRALAVNNLKQLLPSQSEVESGLLTYAYNLLGAEIVSDSSTNHSVSLKLTSSLACLKTYFIRQPSVSVRLFMGSLLVGHTTINMENVLLSEEFNNKRDKNQPRSVTCRCNVSPSHDLSNTAADVKPSIDFIISFSCETPLVKKKSEVAVPALSVVGAGGDADNVQSVLPLLTPRTLPLTLTPRQTPQRPVENGSETYRTEKPVSTHTLNISIVSLLMEEPLQSDSWLRLTCACASVSLPQQVPVLDSGNWLPLHWQLAVTLPRRLLESTLASQPVLLQLGSGNQVIATALLPPPNNLISRNKHSEYTAVLDRSGQRVGEVGVVWTLTNGSSPLQSQSAPTLTDTSISPPTQSRSAVVEALSPRARELKILSFVEELEDWAEKQRIMVMEGLKEEEAARLASLQSRWEAEVGGQVTEGRQLVEALQSMRDQLRQQESDLRDNQQKLKVYKEELELVHRSKLQEFKDLSRRMQDEFNHKLALIASDKVTLEQEVEALKVENAEMKQQLREAETRADSDKRAVDSLSHELKILKEKLEMEQESKKFFKEHCRKAEQEIYRLNCLRQQEAEARLHCEKKSLEQMAFQQIIVERNDLRQDQRVLREIRQQLLLQPDNLDINSNSNLGSVDSDGRTFTDGRYIRRAT